MKVKWKKDELFIIETSSTDTENILKKKGFILYGDSFIKRTFTNFEMTEGFDYEIKGWGIGHYSIFKFPINIDKEYTIKNLVFYGYVNSRKQLIKMLEHYF